MQNSLLLQNFNKKANIFVKLTFKNFKDLKNALHSWQLPCLFSEKVFIT